MSSKLQFCPVIFNDTHSRYLPICDDSCTNPTFFDLIRLEKQICLKDGNKSHTEPELKSVNVKKWTSPVITKRSCARPTLSSYIDKKEQICPVHGTSMMPNLFGLASLKDQDLSKQVCPVLAELTHSTANTGSREKPLLFGVRDLQEEIGLVIAKESCAKPTFCDVVDDIRQVCPVIGKSPFSRIVQETCVTPSLLHLVGLEEFRTLICPVVVRGSCTKLTLFDFLELQDVDAQSCPAIVKGTGAQPTLLNLVNFIQFREPICPVIVKGYCKMPTLNDVLDFKKSRDPTCPIIVKGKCARMTMKKMLGVKNVKYPVCPMIMKRKCKKKTFQKLIGLKKLKTKRLGLKKMRYPVCPMIMKRQCKKKTFQKLISLKKLKTQMLGLKEMKYPVCPMIIKRKCKKKTFQKLIGFKKSKTLTCPVIVKGKHTKMTLGKLKRCARTTFTKLIDFKKLKTSTCPVIVKRRCARKTLKKLVGLRKIKHPVCPLEMKRRCKKKTLHKLIGLKKSKILTCPVIIKGRCARMTLKKLINLKKVKNPICPMTVKGRCKKKTLQQLIGLRKLKLKKLANKTCPVVFRGRCKKTTLKKSISLKKVRPLTCPVSVKGRCWKKTLKDLIQLKKVKDPVCPVVVKGRCRKTTLKKLIRLKRLKPQTCPVVVKGRCRKMSLKKLTVFKKLKDPTCPVNVKGRCTRITLRKFKHLKKLKDPVCPVVVKGRCKKPTVLDLIESMESSCPINMKGLGLWPAFVSVVSAKLINSRNAGIPELVLDDKIGRCRKSCKCKLVEHYSFLKIMQSVDYLRQQCLNTKYIDTDHASIPVLGLDGKIGRCSRKGCKCKLVEHYNFLKTMQSIDYLRQQCINTKFVETDHASISELVLDGKIGRCSRKGCKCQMVEYYSFLKTMQSLDHFRQQCINTKFVETAHDNIYELVSDDKIGRCSRKGCKCKLVEHCSFLKTVQSVDHFRQQCINTKFVETDHNSISELVLDGKFGRCSRKGCKCKLVEYYVFLKTMQSVDHFRQQCMNTEFVETDHASISELVLDGKFGRCSRKGCKCKLVEYYVFLKTMQSVDHFRQQCMNTEFVETDHASISELVLDGKIGRCSRKGCKCQMVEYYSFLKTMQSLDHFRQQCMNTEFVETDHNGIYELDDKIGRCSRKGCKCKLVEHCSFLKTVQSVDHFKQQCINTKFVETTQNTNTNQVTLSHKTSVPIQTKRTLGDLPEPPKIMSKTPLPACKQTLTPIGGTPDSPTIMVKAPKPTLYQTQSPLGDVLESPRIMTKAPITTESPPIMSKAPEPKLSVTLLPSIKKKQGLCPNVYERLAFPARMLTSPAVDNFLVQLPADESDKEEDKDHLKNGTGPPKLQGGDDLIGPTPRCLYPAQ